MRVNDVIYRKMRLLTLGFIAIVIILVGVIVFLFMRPAIADTAVGTCLPIEKGGTGCSAEEMREYLGVEGMLTEERFNDWVESKPKTRIKVIDMGMLPNAGTIMVPHGLTPEQKSKIVCLWGVTKDLAVGNIFTIPFMPEASRGFISLNIIGDNVEIRTGMNRTNFTVTTVYIEYEV